MSNIGRIRLPGFWVLNSVIDPAELEALDEVRPWLANFDAGSTHAPSGFVTVGGSGFQLTGTAHELAASAKLSLQNLAQISIEAGAAIRANGTGAADILLKVSAGGVASLDVSSGAVINVAAGGAVDVLGGLTIKTGGPGAFTAEDDTTSTWADGSFITWALGSTASLRGAVDIYTALAAVKASGQLKWLNGSFLVGESTAAAAWAGTWVHSGTLLFASGTCTVDGTSTLAAASGSVVTLAGTTTFTNSKWPKLSPTRSWTRRSITLAMTTYTNAATNGPDDPDMWHRMGHTAVSPVLTTRPATASGSKSVIEFTNLPQGGTMTSVSITADGTNNTVATLPTYRIVRWQNGLDGYEYMSAVTIDEHDVPADWGDGERTTEVAITAHEEIDLAYRYGVLVTHPYAGATSAMYIHDVFAEGTADSIRV